jgi:hypothetical protein
MATRHIALAGTFLAIVFLAHAAGRFTQIGGAQIAASIAIYALMALILGPELEWGPLAGIALGIGVLTMLATSSPFPLANIPGHGVAFLVACGLAKAVAPRGAPIGLSKQAVIIVVTLVVSWTLFALTTWIGLSGTPFVQNSFNRLGIAFGQGFVAWWLAGFVGVGIPSLVIAMILTPLLYNAVRPALIRQGMIDASAASPS